jgi:hypothetical protein
MLPLAIAAILVPCAGAQANPRGEVEAGNNFGFSGGNQSASGSGQGNVQSVRAMSRVNTVPGPTINMNVTPTFISGGMDVPISAGSLNPPPAVPVFWNWVQSGTISVIYRTGPMGRDRSLFNFSPSVVMVRRFTTTTGTSLSFPKGLFTMAGDRIGIQSETFGWTGLGQMSYDPFNSSYDLLATAQSPGGIIVGQAAGNAIDPFTIASPTPLTYGPSIYGSVDIDPGDVNEFAGADWWASDSYVDPSTGDGDEPSPEDSLWYLSISADQSTANLSDLDIDFDLNPEALNEIVFTPSFLAGLGSYSNSTQEADLIDAYFDDEIDSAITFSGDDATLPTGFDPFPNGTTFLPEGGSVLYADGVDAGIADAPEGGTLGYVLLGVLGLAGFVRVRAGRARAMPIAAGAVR